jgi:hypothetical protein
MKKSERLNIAMDAVLDSEYSNEIKLEVLEVLMEDRRTALYVERTEEENNDSV